MEEKKENFFKEIFKFSLIALLIVVPFRIYIAQPFIVNGASMSPAFETGQYLIVDQLSYRFEEPKRGDVVIFKFPQDTSKFFIKRIIGLPGETIEIRGLNIIVKQNNTKIFFTLDEPYIALENRKEDFITTVLENNEYYVLGDNRRASSDSRVWGTLKNDLIVGRALLRLFPLQTLDYLPGVFNQ